MLTLAEYLSNNGGEVDLFWNNPGLKEKIRIRFDLDLDRVNFVSIGKNILERWKITRKYDMFFWLSDGSVPFLFSQNNVLHFQVPFHGVNGRSLANKIKLKNINHIVCNSKFTKKFIDKEYGVDSEVIYPPVDVDSFKTRGKENIILTVGRFSKLLQAKRQDILIEAFKKMVDNGLKDWKFQLAGSTDVGGWEYLAALKSLAGDYPIEFYENCSFDILKNLYSKAKIFWYAGGYGIDEEKEPEKVEHFGITVVEAMAAGCIPFVCPKGGLKETVKDKKTGFYYQNLAQLQSFTQKLILDSQKTENMAKEVVKSSYQFGKNAFCEKFKEILK